MSGEAHYITVVHGEIVETDYAEGPGGKAWVAWCSCGWRQARQLRPAVFNQVGKHRAQVAP